jgi:hypothetical protein
VTPSENVYSNVNQIYMAGLMTAPMVAIELVVMRAMYHDMRMNAVILAASIVPVLPSSSRSANRLRCRIVSFSGP